MIDEKLAQLAKDFLKENGIDDGLRDYLEEKGYRFDNEDEWREMLIPVIKEMGVPEEIIEETISESF